MSHFIGFREGFLGLSRLWQLTHRAIEYRSIAALPQLPSRRVIGTVATNLNSTFDTVAYQL
jgi:hypothetical protein